MDLPFRILRPFLGARIIKTGLAVFIALASFHWIGSDYATFGAVAAILAIQPSVTRAKSVFTQQLLANLIGGAIATGLGLWLGSSELVMALGVILVLGITTRLGLTEAAGIAVFAVLFIMDRPSPDFLLYTAGRVGTIIGGMLIGYLVNRFILPPNFSVRIREELQSAQEGIGRFSDHLLASLASPEHYQKAQIKEEAGAIHKRLEAARYLLDFYHETAPTDPRLLPLEKAKASLYVFVERITDIHKIILKEGGLRPGPELGAVANALKAVQHYKAEVIGAALAMSVPEPSVAAACQESITALSDQVDAMIADPKTRPRGLALHSVLTNIRHMTWRMDSLSRLLARNPG